MLIPAVCDNDSCGILSKGIQHGLRWHFNSGVQFHMIQRFGTVGVHGMKRHRFTGNSSYGCRKRGTGRPYKVPYTWHIFYQSVFNQKQQCLTQGHAADIHGSGQSRLRRKLCFRWIGTVFDLFIELVIYFYMF